MIHPRTLHRLISDTLTYLPRESRSPAAVELLILTHAHEGTFWRGGNRTPVTALWQLGRGLEPRGPALGIYQMEGATHDSVWENWIMRRPHWRRAIFSLLNPPWSEVEDVPRDEEDLELVIYWGRSQLPTNLAYATAMARAYYYAAPAPLPAPDDIPALARYWHKWWCRGCAGTAKEAEGHYRLFTGKGQGEEAESVRGQTV